MTFQAGTMGKADRLRAQSARQKIAAQQAAARRSETRRRLVIAGGSVAVVLVLVTVVIVVSLTRSPASSAPAVTDSAIAREIVTVPAATYNDVGAGTATGLNPISGEPELTVSGKPELLYMGGEFCPYCAAERWVIAAAVSRFGALTGLRFIHSSPLDIYPSTPTLTFASASYTSKYLAFVPVEWYGEKPDPATPFGHVYLQHPTQQQQALFARYGGSAIPFVDIGNRYDLPQIQYAPSALAGLSWSQVAAAMRNPASPIGKDIDGAANKITAAICQLTKNRPVGACASAGVKAASKSI
jgi:thiol-disulfide isomerase/thioredoxin